MPIIWLSQADILPALNIPFAELKAAQNFFWAETLLWCTCERRDHLSWWPTVRGRRRKTSRQSMCCVWMTETKCESHQRRDSTREAEKLRERDRQKGNEAKKSRQQKDRNTEGNSQRANYCHNDLLCWVVVSQVVQQLRSTFVTRFFRVSPRHRSSRHDIFE